MRWAICTESLFGHELISFRYGQVGLRDLNSESYLTGNPVAATLATLMKPIKLHPAEVKLASLQTVIKSSLTEGDKLFLIDVIQTYLPREGLENAGDEIMETLLDTELTWAERVLTAVSLTDIQIPETNGESANAG